jgi:hypothetical protein
VETNIIGNETTVCPGSNLDITVKYDIDCTFDDDSLSYKWEFRSVENNVWVTLKHDTIIFADCSNVPETPGDSLTTWTISSVSASDEGYYRLLVGSPSSIGNTHCRASSDSVFVHLRKVPIVPDVRIDICPKPARQIYLTSFLDSLDYTGVAWTKGNNASPAIAPETGKIDISSVKQNATYTYKYTLTSECGSNSAIAYVHVLGNRLLRKIDTVVICQTQELSKYVQLNQLFGLELGGTWKYDDDSSYPGGPVNPDNIVELNVKQFLSSSKYRGALVFNAHQAWKDVTYSGNPGYSIIYNGDTGAKKFVFHYIPPSDGACVTQTQKLVIIVTSKLVGN